MVKIELALVIEIFLDKSCLTIDKDFNKLLFLSVLLLYIKTNVGNIHMKMIFNPNTV